MHQYLKAIGFSGITKAELKNLLKKMEKSYSSQEMVMIDEELDFCEFRKEYGKRVGLGMCGEMNLMEVFEREYYYPYFRGTGVTSYSDIIIEKKIDQDAFIGICEDPKIGVSIIFDVQNPAEYMREKQIGNLIKKSASVTLSGLALGATILLPVLKCEANEQERQEESRNRMMLLSAAREGDQQAIETLTLDDIDTYSKVTKRLETEDVFSIVESCFMPYGLECTLYSILGEIIEIEPVINGSTEEQLLCITVDVNELRFDICVPSERILGEPQAGRRIKANIWLQGELHFD